MSTGEDQFEGWAILEIMGRRRLAGWVSEATIAGAGLLRIDVPGTEPGVVSATQYYSPSAVYALTPTTEAIARAVACRFQPEPVTRWELPQLEVARDRYEEDEPAREVRLEDRDDDGGYRA